LAPATLNFALTKMWCGQFDEADRKGHVKAV